MGIWAVILLIAGAVVLGTLIQGLELAFGQPSVRYEWLMTAIAAGVGGFIASEWLGTASTWGPEVDGMFVLPALIGGIVLGGLVSLVYRMVARPSQPAV